MANATIAAQTEPTQFQQLVEELRIANLHVCQLLEVAEERAADHTASVIKAASRYALDAFYAWEKIEAIANAQAAKGGA